MLIMSQQRTKRRRLSLSHLRSTSASPSMGEIATTACSGAADNDLVSNVLTTTARPHGTEGQTNCPVCAQLVNIQDINQHLDSQCTLTKVFRSPAPPIRRARSLPGNGLSNPKPELIIIDDQCALDARPTHNDGPAVSQSAPSQQLLKNLIDRVAESEAVNDNRSRGCEANTSLDGLADIDGNRCESPSCESDVSTASECALPLEDPSLLATDSEDVSSASIRTPFYLTNLEFVIDAIADAPWSDTLFNADDRKLIVAFRGASEPARKLYARLFMRKRCWFRVHKLNYPELEPQLPELIAELESADHVLSSETSLSDVAEALQLLQLNEVTLLAKSLGVKLKGGNSKSLLVPEIQRFCRSQRTLFGQGDRTEEVLQRIKKAIGPCIRVALDATLLYERLLMLFFHSTEHTGSQAMTAMVLSNIGKLQYPAASLVKDTVRPLFDSREELLAYQDALFAEHDFLLAHASGDTYKAMSKVPGIIQDFRTQFNVQSVHTRAESLPLYRRQFTAAWVRTRMAATAIPVLERGKKHDDAISLLRALLDQAIYCPHSRGGWWDRLALNLMHHVKESDAAANACMAALQDPYVRSGRRLAIEKRLSRLVKRGVASVPDGILKYAELLTAPTCSINGFMYADVETGKKSVFIAKDGEELCSVEQLAIHYYIDNGGEGWKGIHAENMIFMTIFGLLFWDILYADIPDVFLHKYQSAPLDMHSDHFYDVRRELIDRRLEEIGVLSGDEIGQRVRNAWEAYEGQVLAGVSWDRWTAHDVAAISTCMGSGVVRAFCERLSRDHRHSCGGLPDLTLWNESAGQCKLVEVKGPNDRMSEKQLIWADALLRAGADYEICNVGSRSGRSIPGTLTSRAR